MEVAKEVSLSSVIIEIDCKNVANLANKKVSNGTEIWWTMAEIHKSIQDCQLISFQHVSRKCNGFVHFFAKRALCSSESVIWRNNFPNDVLCMFESLV